MSKKEKISDLEKIIFQELEQLENMNTIDELQNPEDVLMGMPAPVDFSIDISRAQAQARKTILSLFNFYLEEKMISENAYVRYKAVVSTTTLEQLMFLMTTGQQMLIKLMSSISVGEDGPRMFEVLANLQRSQLEIIKNYSSYLVIAESEAKKIQEDIEFGTRKPEQVTEGSEAAGFVSNNEREMLKAIETAAKKTNEIGFKKLDDVKGELADAKITQVIEILPPKKQTLSDEIDVEELDGY